MPRCTGHTHTHPPPPCPRQCLSPQDQLRALQRELSNRDEKIRRLEMQLRGAYLGVNNALRAGVRDSQITDPDDLSDVGEMQNLLELHISDASVFVSARPFPSLPPYPHRPPSPPAPPLAAVRDSETPLQNSPGP